MPGKHRKISTTRRNIQRAAIIGSSLAGATLLGMTTASADEGNAPAESSDVAVEQASQPVVESVQETQPEQQTAPEPTTQVAPEPVVNSAPEPQAQPEPVVQTVTEPEVPVTTEPDTLSQPDPSTVLPADNQSDDADEDQGTAGVIDGPDDSDGSQPTDETDTDDPDSEVDPGNQPSDPVDQEDNDPSDEVPTSPPVGSTPGTPTTSENAPPKYSDTLPDQGDVKIDLITPFYQNNKLVGVLVTGRSTNASDDTGSFSLLGNVYDMTSGTPRYDVEVDGKGNFRVYIPIAEGELENLVKGTAQVAIDANRRGDGTRPRATLAFSYDAGMVVIVPDPECPPVVDPDPELPPTPEHPETPEPPVHPTDPITPVEIPTVDVHPVASPVTPTTILSPEVVSYHATPASAKPSAPSGLAYTGGNTGDMAGLAGLLILGGTGAIVAGYRRRENS